MKKIVFVCNRLHGGGAERVLTSLSNYFDENGYDVNIIACDASERYPINPSVKVVEISDTGSLLKQSRAIRVELKRIRADIIISFEFFVNLATIIAATGLKGKVIVSERNDPAKVGSGLGKDQLRNFLYRYCDTLVCQTPDAKAYFPNYIQNHSTVIPNPVKDNLPQRWDGERTHRVVNFCRLNKQKNLKLLIDAFADFHNDFSDYKLVIYGDGPEKDTISNYICQKSMTEFVELKPSASDVHAQVISSTMFVSSSDYEGLSNSMLEAMAIGLPAVCTDCPCGGARLMIQDGKNGLLVPTGDCERLSSAMKRVAQNREFADELSRQAAKLREELSIDRIARQWEALF